MSGNFFTSFGLRLRCHRIWLKIDRPSADECWEWQGARLAKGYGRVKIERKAVLAHRVAYEMANGRFTEREAKMMVLHSCDNPPCCNPRHLRLGTASENVRDMFKRNRKSRIPPWHPDYQKKPVEAA